MIVFLCGSCHALVDANKKITKSLDKLNKYLIEKGLIYQKIIEIFNILYWFVNEKAVVHFFVFKR